MEITSYPNYLIYPDGKVQNKKTGRYLKPRPRNGYGLVNLCKNGKYINFKIHRLVALHYITNTENKPFVDHKDGNKSNNDISNLRWVTHQENCNGYKSIQSNNKSGIKNICFTKNKLWKYEKVYFGDKFMKYNKNKQLILWVKFVDTLLIQNKNSTHHSD